MLVALSFCDRIQAYVVLDGLSETTSLMQVLSFQVSIRKWTSSKIGPQNFETLTGNMINDVKYNVSAVCDTFLLACCLAVASCW